MLVAGGSADFKRTSDVNVIDLDTMTARKVTDSEFAFDSYSTAAQDRDGNVLGIALDNNKQVHVMLYNSSANTMKSISNLGPED